MQEDWGTRSDRWAGIRSEMVPVRGTAVHTLRAGEDQGGVPQLLVHGLGGSATNWLEVMGALAQRGPVLAPDLPGFGRTEPPRETATHVRANARFLLALLDEVGWTDRVQIHGNSMGGLLSVLVASAAPHQVDRLVLVSPGLTMSRGAIRQIHPATVARLLPFALPGVGAQLIKRAHGKMTPQQLFDDLGHYIHSDPTRVSPELAAVGLENVEYGRTQDWRLPGFTAAAESTVRTLASRRRVEQAVRDVQAPPLVVWGDQDRLVGRAIIDRVQDLQPDWKVAILNDVGHAAMMETPDTYLATVEPWLDAASDRSTVDEVAPS